MLVLNIRLLLDVLRLVLGVDLKSRDVLLIII